MQLNSSNTSDAVCWSIAYMYNITRLVVFAPLSLVILHIAYRRWRPQRSFKSTTHTDIITLHAALLELLYAPGVLLFLWGSFSQVARVEFAGYFLVSITYFGLTFFHVLTCIERYLAVLRPLIYCQLRTRRGVQVRNILLAAVWFLSLLLSSGLHIEGPIVRPVVLVCSCFPSLLIVLYCSLSVLCVLLRPGPGEGGRQRMDKSKLKAFFTIAVISGVVLFWFLVFLVITVTSSFVTNVACVLVAYGYWCSLPNSLVLPLLYLQRNRKLLGCSSAKESK